jgi:hypothetical protein
VSGQLVELDSRRRVSLGKLAAHDRYLVRVESDGTIVLTPAQVVPLSRVESTDRMLDDDLLR